MNLIALCCAMLLETTQEDLRRLQELRRTMGEKQTEAAALLRAAHEELDRGNYDSAVEKHRRGRALESERDALKKTEVELLEKSARALLKDLDHDIVETRDRASRLLVSLGPSAIPILEKLAPGPSAEVQYRLADVIAKLKRMEIDSEGRLHQWAATARASSEYSATDWWSEERRVGKECRSRWSPYHYKKEQNAREDRLARSRTASVAGTHHVARETV